MQTNRIVNIRRLTAPSGLGGTSTAEMFESSVGAWLDFRTRLLVTAEGDEIAADAELRIPSVYGIQKNDLVEDVDDPNKYYRVEQREEVLSPVGRVQEHRCILIRDNSHEPS